MGICCSSNADGTTTNVDMSSDKDAENIKPMQSTSPGIPKASKRSSFNKKGEISMNSKTSSKIKAENHQNAMHKRIAVAAESLAEDGEIEIPNFPKTDKEKSIIDKAVIGNLLFDTLSIPAKSAIIDSMTPLEVEAGEVLIQQGDTVATKFYVLEKGQCDVYISKNGQKPLHVFTYKDATGFGELALLFSAPRAATVITAVKSKLWVMERTVYNAVKHNLEKKMIEERTQLVEKVPLLQMLSNEHKTLLAEHLEMSDYKHDAEIIKEGEIGDKFYIIKEGKVTVTKNGHVIDKLGVGDYFGERALIRDEKRIATITSEGYVVCFNLSRSAFNKLLGPIETLWRFEVLKKVPLLYNLSEKQLWKMAEKMEEKYFKAGELAIKKGDHGDEFYIIEEGNFSIFDDSNIELARIGKGSCFGELALLKDEVRQANVTSLTEGKCLTLNREQFDQMLGSLTQIQNMWRFEALRRVPLLSQLTAEQRSMLCDIFEQKIYKKGEIIIKQGDDGDCFYIVESGIVGVYKDGNEKPITKLGPTSYFGELALLRNEKRQCTVAALTDVTVLSMEQAEFTELLGPLQEIMKNQSKSYDAVTKNKLGTNINTKDLRQIGILGTGGFGCVVLVEYKTRHYALKCMSKSYIIESGLQEHVTREKDIMLELQSPFIVNLLATFKDSHTIYMLMDAIMGGELFAYLQRRRKPLTEEHARFYAASVICAFEYLQERQMVYRDLKPENLLIDVNGYVKVTDFGFAKRMNMGNKTHTLCGTPEYLAPEIVKQTGHNHAADWWSFGIMLYELVTGRPPFYDDDRVKMFKKICDVRYSFPVNMSHDMRDLIRRLLVKKPAMRLGAQKNGASDIKNHAWFDGFDWSAFQAQKLTPPYIPKVSGMEDISNFEPPPDAETHPAIRRTKRYVSTGIFKDF